MIKHVLVISIFLFCNNLVLQSFCQVNVAGAVVPAKNDSLPCGRDGKKVDCNEDLEFDPNSKRVFHVKYGDLYTGDCESCHENGNKQYSASFRDGYEDGVSWSYYEDGSKESMRSHTNGVENGDWMFWYNMKDTNQLAWHFQFLNGKRHGKCVWYYPNGNEKKVEEYKDGLLDGVVIKYWGDDGKKKSEIYFQAGKYHGSYKTFHKNGELSIETEYSYGLKHGIEKNYFDNKQISLEGEWVEGKRNGEWNLYFSNGVKRFHGNYELGVKQGEFKTYYEEDGRLKSEELYVDGVLMSQYKFDEFGNYVDDKGKMITKEEADERNDVIAKAGQEILDENKKWWKKIFKKKKKDEVEEDEWEFTN